mgnify:CR=1 FL=1
MILSSIKFGDQIGGPYQLAKILTTNIKENEGFNATDLTNKYLEWWKNDAFDTGPTFASVFTKIESGMDPNKAVFKTHEQFDQNTAGCGPAHRASPIAGFMEINSNQLIQLARDEAKITHYHKDAGNGSAIIVILCRYLLEGKSFNEAQEIIATNNDLKQSWNKVQNAELKPDGYIFNVIHSAIHFIKHNKSFDETIRFAGKANYCPILFSAINACLNN